MGRANRCSEPQKPLLASFTSTLTLRVILGFSASTCGQVISGELLLIRPAGMGLRFQRGLRTFRPMRLRLFPSIPLWSISCFCNGYICRPHTRPLSYSKYRNVRLPGLNETMITECITWTESRIFTSSLSSPYQKPDSLAVLPDAKATRGMVCSHNSSLA